MSSRAVAIGAALALAACRAQPSEPQFPNAHRPVAPIVGDTFSTEDARDRLSDRVQRENLDNVAVKLGAPDNPMLPQSSFDRVFLVHMYHEVESPYAFLWHLRDGVKPDGFVIVVDSNRPVSHHGIPPAQLKCEFAALGLQPVKFSMLTGGDAYYAAFRAVGPRPAPPQIKACQS